MNDNARPFGCQRQRNASGPYHGSTLGLLTVCTLFAACSGSVSRDADPIGSRGTLDGGVEATDPSTTRNADDPAQSGSEANTTPTPNGSNGDATSAELTPSTPSTDAAQGFVRVRRLSNREYNNTVRDLLGTTLTPASNFLKETAHGFDNIAGSLGMTATQYAAYFGSAADVAKDVFSNEKLRAPFETCGARNPDSACVDATIQSFGTRALRRPLTSDEVRTYRDVYDRAVDLELSSVEAFEQVVRAMLSSVEFLYRLEFAQPATEPTGNTQPGSNEYELASRLSYFLWSTMPDAALFDAAASGQLSDLTGLSAHVERMLASPKASALVDSFAWQWLGMQTLESHAVLSDSFPEWDEPLRAAMLGEAREYLTHFVLGDAAWKDFLSADLHFVNARLAAHYAASNVSADNMAFAPYAGDTPSRIGFMGTAAFLTVSSFAHRTSPTLRAKWVLDALLCAPPPPPPAQLTIPDLDADEAANQAASIDNVRERLALHRSDPNCASCHQYLDPLGLALENFDAIGRHRQEYDDGTPIDATGELPDGTPLAGLPDLVSFIGKDDRFLRCTADKLFTYAMGRAPTAQDAPALADVRAGWQAEAPTFRRLVEQLAVSVPFTQRQEASQE